MTGDQAKRKLRQKGLTVRQFADTHGFPYYMVSRVINGVYKGNFGKAHEIAVALGMKEKIES